MPSERRQLNVRLTESAMLRLVQLTRRIKERSGQDDLSQAAVIAMALVALEKEYPPGPEEQPAAEEKPAKRKRRESKHGGTG